MIKFIKGLKKVHSGSTKKCMVAKKLLATNDQGTRVPLSKELYAQHTSPSS